MILKYIRLLTSVIILNLILLTLPQTVFSKDPKCECDFDTPSYTAECDCALACAVAMEGGKKCNIVCDGSPASAEHGYHQAFGRPTAYLEKMNSIKGAMLAVGFNAFRNSGFTQDALPNLLRSSYIGASFISSEKKIEIDKIVNDTFRKYSREISQSFTVKDNKPFEKKLKDGTQIEASFKKINLVILNYNISLNLIR